MRKCWDMSKDDNSIVIFKNPILEDYFSIPDKPNNSHSGTLTRIKNAWTSFAHVDDTGVLWINSSRLADILRTNESNANYKLRDIPDSSKKRVDNKLFIRGYEVRKLIDESIQTEGNNKRKEYLRYSEELYKCMRDCQFVDGIRSIYALQLQDNRRTLKRKRISRYKKLLKMN